MQTEQQQPATKPNGNGATVTALVPTQPAAITALDDSRDSIAAFASMAKFEAAQRMAKALSLSTLVPKEYQGPQGFSNCLIAMELASRVKASVFMVMQNLDIIHGRPSWRAQFLIATVNSSGRFTPLRYRFEGKPGTDEWGCRAYAQDKETGEECVGSLITIGIAKSEGWHGKSGSKWKTMPEQMLTYRAASFWARVYAPEISLGMQTADEAIDTYGHEVRSAELPGQRQPGNAERLTAALLDLPAEPPPQQTEAPSSPVEEPAKQAAAPKEEPKAAKRSAKNEAAAAAPPHDAETGEVLDAPKVEAPEREPGEEG